MDAAHMLRKLSEDQFNRKFGGSGIALINNEAKDIIKRIRFLENIEILSKENTRKINSQKGWLLNFLLH